MKFKSWLKDQKNWRFHAQYFRYWDGELWVKLGIYHDQLARMVMVGIQVKVFSFYVCLYLSKPIRRK